MRHTISLFFEITEYKGIKVLFDRDCPVCMRGVAWMRPIWEPRGFKFLALQADWIRRRLALPEEELLRAIRVVLPDGRMMSGADAHVLLWSHVWWLWPLWLADKLPGVHWLIRFVYGRLSASRYRVSHGLGCADAYGREDLTHNPKRKENST